MLVAGALAFVIEMVVDRFWTVGYRVRSWSRSVSMSLLLIGAVATVLLEGVPWLLTRLSDYALDSASAWAGLIHQLGLVPTALCNEVLAHHDACGVTGRGAPVPASTTTVGTISVASVVSAVLAVLGAAKGLTGGTGDSSGLRAWWSRGWAKVKDSVVPWLAVVVVVVVAVVVLLRWVAALVERPTALGEWRYVAVLAGLLLAAKLGTEPNRTSLHHFFRERISEAFLVCRRPDRVEPVGYRRPLRFSEAAPQDAGPGLVACAVANVTDQDLVPSRRGCTPFVFDHRRIGLTDRLLPQGAAQRASGVYDFAADSGYRDATIPGAVAVSAAAFSPLAGRENVRLGPYRAILALGMRGSESGYRTRCGSTKRLWSADHCAWAGTTRRRRSGTGCRRTSRRGWTCLPDSARPCSRWVLTGETCIKPDDDCGGLGPPVHLNRRLLPNRGRATRWPLSANSRRSRVTRDCSTPSTRS